MVGTSQTTENGHSWNQGERMAFPENFCMEIWLLNFLDFLNENLTLGIPNNTACNVRLAFRIQWNLLGCVPGLVPPPHYKDAFLSQLSCQPSSCCFGLNIGLIFPMLAGSVAVKEIPSNLSPSAPHLLYSHFYILYFL